MFRECVFLDCWSCYKVGTKFSRHTNSKNSVGILVQNKYFSILKTKADFLKNIEH